jgi:hypothetical protein
MEADTMLFWVLGSSVLTVIGTDKFQKKLDERRERLVHKRRERVKPRGKSPLPHLAAALYGAFWAFVITRADILASPRGAPPVN